MKPTWFSAMLRFVVLVEGIGTTDVCRSVVVFRSTSFAAATKRALELGISKERTYHNGDGQEVRWRLVRIETLDQLDDELIDGREVYAEPLTPDTEDAFQFNARFAPDEVVPGHSGV